MALLDRFTHRPAWRRGAGDDLTTLGEPRVEPGPEMFKRQDGSEVEITDAPRQQWERKGVTSVVRLRDVGTCRTNNCHEKGKDERSLRGVDLRLQSLSGTFLPPAERSPVTESSPSGESPPSPAKRGRLGFSRTALSVAGVVVLLGFLMWFFVFV